MSVADQITRLQNVRNQIRKRMISLGLSKQEDEDLLQTLASSLDTVDKIEPGKSATDPEGYTLVDTLDRSTSDRYIKVPRGYNNGNKKFKISKVINGSVEAVAEDPKIADPAPIEVDPSGTTKKYVKISEGYLPSRQITINKMKAGSIEKVSSDPGTNYPSAVTEITPSKTAKQYVKVSNGYLSDGKIVVGTIPSPYFDTSGVTATDTAVLKGYKFVDSTGTTVTGTVATATGSNISGFVAADSPSEIVLNTDTTSSSSSTIATATATVTKELYTGSSGIKNDLTSKEITTSAKATLASSVSGSKTVPTTLPSGTVSITPETDNVKRIYEDTTNKGFVTKVVIEAMSSATYTNNGTTDPGNDYTNKLSVDPSGTDPKYIKITKGHTPNSKITINKMSAGAFSSVTTTDPGTDYSNKATVIPSTETKYVAVSAGYLPNSKITINAMASGSVSEATTTDPGTSYGNIATVTPSTSPQYVKVSAGYLSNGKIKVNAIPSASVTLKTGDWAATTTSLELGGYTLSVTVTGVTTSSYVVVYPSDTAAAKTYGVYAYSQAKDSLTFRAFDKPTADMRYTVYYFS